MIALEIFNTFCSIIGGYTIGTWIGHGILTWRERRHADR